ncbi:bifunctional YncE family protein/alkaline phosphatase family protein [Hymenobacter sp. BRD128]|uniref:bifunctional YncE family protein/alkaline phosphatase family protein n=1 Tax=Hymenobacter sp. BRD128 TaxID=2675878 RepID=UPI0015643E27|nr:bifunctional YncE family protein/alkaline phosphatase family protein [Hymenobacter sp. BRD128]QKG58455.1 bifunctional YncE family protein/alkaline phosphatase family protein [Hymenobacter sp. BRD128]
MNYFLTLSSLCVGIGIGLSGCSVPPTSKTTASLEQADMHQTYDDSTLRTSGLPVLLPYNRLVAPAGQVVRYGDPGLENHSLDAQLVPGAPLLAVEDRYGVALLDTARRAVVARWTYADDARYKGAMSTYSGLKVRREADGEIHLFWSASNGQNRQSYVLDAVYAAGKIRVQRAFPFAAVGAPLALPNDLALATEGGRDYLYVVLNGNNQVVKLDRATGQTVWTRPTGVAPYGLALAGGRVFVSNWGGPLPTDTLHQEVAGVPRVYGRTYTVPATGATAQGTVSVLHPADGQLVQEVPVGLHPNALLASPDEHFVYVANGNSDEVSVLETASLHVSERLAVQLLPGPQRFGGDSPNALALDPAGTTLYVANGLDNAVAVVRLGRAAARAGAAGPSQVLGFIPTEAYPGGLALGAHQLFVTNLEGEGARVSARDIQQAGGELEAVARRAPAAYNSHHQLATVSLVALPTAAQLARYSEQVERLNFSFRREIARRLPRPGVLPRPMPERIGEPSVFKHVVYIIKENRTYDQVLGDLPAGRGEKSLCVFGDSVTPNQHQLARDFVLLDNYYVSGKSSAEGHQWTDAAMVTDYVEKNVRAWFRSYPHVQEDALVYSPQGFIWNNAADHGHSVRIYGEACKPHYDTRLSWSDIYANYRAGKPFQFTNTSTIARVRPLLSPNYPGSDELRITDQLRADAFIKELAEFEKQPGEALPELSVIALSTDHTVGTRPGMPTPRAMVADNDLALGRMLAALSKSRFWKNTVVFVTEDDSQAGWDHVSAYRTTGFVVSPYSRLHRTVSKNYNQTCMVRSIEQILGLPPMNAVDATALPLFECFGARPSGQPYRSVPNRVALTTLNPPLSKLTGAARRFGRLSQRPEFDHLDGGRDDVLNRIIWFATKGRQPYPAALAGKAEADDDDD